MHACARVLVGYGAAGVLLWLFLRDAEWRALVDSMRVATWSLLIAAALARLASLAVSSLRWRILLSPVRAVPIGTLMAATMMGMAVSTTVSMQAAEVVRPYIACRDTALDFRAAIATIAVEWFFDLLAVLMLFVPARAWLIRGDGMTGHWRTDLALAGLAVFSIGGLIVLRWGRRRLIPVQRWIRDSARLPQALRDPIADHVQQFATGLEILERGPGLVAVGACSLGAASLIAISAWLALRAFGLPLSFASGFVILGLVTVGGMIPTPGAVGGFHAVCQFGLVRLLNVDPTITIAPVIALHAVLYVPAAALGTLLFARLPPPARRDYLNREDVPSTTRDDTSSSR